MNAPDTTPRIVVPPALSNTRHLAPPAAANPATQVIAEADSAHPTPQSDLHAQYAILGKIGDGGMGIVYLASDRRLGRHVAIKRLKPSAQENPSLRHRFLHEARAAASLAHPHIVHCYGLGDDAEGPYIAMEYVAGGAPSETPQPAGTPHPPQTLEQYITHRGALPLETALELLLKLSRAIAYAHGCGVIHRDLKPANVLMDRSGEPKIVDFGLARLMRTEDSQLTTPGEKLLSLGYGAPEQETDASSSDERADVYGLGAILYFCLTGQNPRYFREEDLPPAVRPALCKAMARDREQRWPDVEAFAASLRALQGGGPAPTPTKTTWRCKWCDTVNPVSTHFCAECGWDGGESCRECGAETHFGIPFCKTCGANARDYEQAAITLARSRQALAQGQFEAALAHASRAIALEPTGPSGRRMLEDLREIRSQAETVRARRDSLRKWIPMELLAENFERARTFIEELRALSADPGAFAQELAGIPDRIVRRDLGRIRRCFREQDWVQGERLLDALRELGAADNPAFRKLARQARRHRQGRTLRRSLACATGAFTLYALAMPPALRGVGRWRPPWFDPLFRPARILYRLPHIEDGLRRYAAAWGVPPEALRATGAEPAAAAPDTPPDRPPPPSGPDSRFDPLQQAFQEQVRESQAELRNNMAAWPAEYRRELKLQRDRHQSAGDYSGWHAIDRELARFESGGDILPPAAGDPEDLKKLKGEFLARIEGFQLTRMRRLVSATKRTINEMGTLLRELTKTGAMEAAERVDREIARLRTDPEYVEAERTLAEYEASRPEELAALLALGATEIGELRELRNGYDLACQAVATEYAERLEAWPSEYTAALQKFMEGRLRAGDYMGYEAAKLELERFELDGTLSVPEPVAGAVEAPLDALKRRFVERRERYDADRARGIARSADDYRTRLDRLVSEYTKSRKIDAAAAAAADLRRLRASAQVLEAQEQARKPETPAQEPADAP